MKTLVIIPAYNEEAALPGVIDDLRRHAPGLEIVVVNDGSRDHTARIAADAGLEILNLPFNLGIGGAMQTGYRYARDNNYDVAVQFDADGQHVAAEIESLLKPLQEGTADIVIGSRFLDQGAYQASPCRRLGIRVFSTVLSRILSMPVTDTTSGFRAANRMVINSFSRGYPEDYPEVESLVLLHRKQLRIREIPVQMRARSTGQSSITSLRSVYYMIKVLLAICIDLLKKGEA